MLAMSTLPKIMVCQVGTVRARGPQSADGHFVSRSCFDAVLVVFVESRSYICGA